MCLDYFQISGWDTNLWRCYTNQTVRVLHSVLHLNLLVDPDDFLQNYKGILLQYETHQHFSLDSLKSLKCNADRLTGANLIGATVSNRLSR